VTNRQRENAARYAYDLSKIVVGAAAITNAFSEHFRVSNFAIGIALGIVMFYIGQILDGMEGGP